MPLNRAAEAAFEENRAEKKKPQTSKARQTKLTPAIQKQLVDRATC